MAKNDELKNKGFSEAIGTNEKTAGTDDVQLLIEELKQRTSALEQANRELRRISHYRSLFLGRMSHELRTPLTSVLGFTEILLDQEELSESQRRFCKKIQDSGLQLQASLDQLVDLSRIEADRTEIFLQQFSLRETVRDSCAAVARLAQRRQVIVEYELAPDLTMVVSDQGRVRQILYSFLAWSVSRSAAGQNVYLKIWLDESQLQLEMRDDGEVPEDLSHVFEPDNRGNSGELPNLDELGVIIGRRLVDMLGGKITPTMGSTGLKILIELPAGPVREQ
ncbi:MAG TPA: HAMP domain-containing sensor histidine kinase [Pyrinomonadaceae bacterium]|nr:HAMP domain-containing sensor histidine kinase [Pyrinomonadaceae bacterium]